ncbi:MAG: sensor histidine kinase [Candidatus Midichloriaceae bacterium]
MRILEKIKFFFKESLLKIEENEKLYFILCILILLINIPLTIFELKEDDFLINSIIAIDLIAIALSVFYLVYRLVLKKTKYLKALRIIILLFCIAFFPWYSLFLSNYGDQWIIRLILSFGMLYIYSSNRFAITLSSITGILAYLLYLFVSNIYGVNTESVMLEYIEHYTIFNNGVFSISLVLLVVYKITYTSNQIEISKAFASAIAHEVFSPISIVKVKAEMLLEKITNNDKSDLEDRVKELIKLTNYCMRSVEIILTASKNVNTEYSDIKKYSVIKCVEIALEEFYLSEEQRLRIHVDKSSDFKFKGSRHLFKHIVFNLIKNTLSHAGNNANIYIWVEKNKLHYKDDSNGIKEDELPKIFNADFSKGKFGIGLHFCKKAMERMGGKIKCISKFGVYTEFIVYFSKHFDND